MTKRKILGIFRGFPGLGRVVAGVSLLETLSNKYDIETLPISYLQGNEYLYSKGYIDLKEATCRDYCAIGILPTGAFGYNIHKTIQSFSPDMVLLDGEPLMVQSIRLSYPNIKIVVLLNPADVDNPNNDKEAMDYFNFLYSLSDVAIVHGLKRVHTNYQYKELISIGTILREEIFQIRNTPANDIYCILGGGTINVDNKFTQSTIRIAELCIHVANQLKGRTMHIACSSKNIYDILAKKVLPTNVVLYDQVLNAVEYYSKASLIITRSGRNTLSELAYLGIPAITFVVGDRYRSEEQKQNLACLYGTNISSASPEISDEEFAQLCKKTLETSPLKSNFIPGNNEAINKILSMLVLQ